MVDPESIRILNRIDQLNPRWKNYAGLNIGCTLSNGYEASIDVDGDQHQGVCKSASIWVRDAAGGSLSFLGGTVFGDTRRVVAAVLASIHREGILFFVKNGRQGNI